MPKYKVRTRKEAATLGLKKFFTGKPCNHGHNAFRYVRNGMCTRCNYERVRAWVSDHPERAYTLKKQWRDKNPERFRELRARWRRENPEKVKIHNSRQLANQNKRSRKATIALRILKKLALENPSLRPMMRQLDDLA